MKHIVPSILPLGSAAQSSIAAVEVEILCLREHHVLAWQQLNGKEAVPVGDCAAAELSH